MGVTIQVDGRYLTGRRCNLAASARESAEAIESGAAGRPRRGWLVRSTGECFLLFIVFMVSSLNVSHDAVRPLGKAAVVLMFVCTSVLLLLLVYDRIPFPSQLLGTLPYVLLLAIVHAPVTGGEFGKHGLTVLSQVVLVYSFFLAMALSQWPPDRIAVLRRCALVCLLTYLVCWAVGGMAHPYAWYFVNTNACGAFLGAIGFFCFLGRRNPTTVARGLVEMSLLAMVTVALHLTGTRSVMLAVAVAVFTYFCWPALSRTRALFVGYYILLLAGIAVIIYVASYRMNDLLSSGYGEATAEVTGKNLASGRDRIWPELIAAVQNRPVFGYGSGLDIDAAFRIPFNSHNWYLQVAVQVGLLGLFLFFLLFRAIWRMLWLGRALREVRLSGAMFAGVAVHQAFEVTITQSNLALSMPCWVGLGIGVSYSLAAVRSNEESVHVRGRPFAPTFV